MSARYIISEMNSILGYDLEITLHVRTLSSRMSNTDAASWGLDHLVMDSVIAWLTEPFLLDGDLQSAKIFRFEEETIAVE
jgi:hypothetical protein